MISNISIFISVFIYVYIYIYVRPSYLRSKGINLIQDGLRRSARAPWIHNLRRFLGSVDPTGAAWRYRRTWLVLSQMLHVWNMYLQNWIILGVNVGKYSIHGASGIEMATFSWLVDWLQSMDFPLPSLMTRDTICSAVAHNLHLAYMTHRRCPLSAGKVAGRIQLRNFYNHITIDMLQLHRDIVVYGIYDY